MSSGEADEGAAAARPPRGGATRAALVGTARALFTERGYAGVGTEEVVRRAGVTRGALYHHFRDKQDLFRAVYEELEGEVVAAIAARIDGIEDPLELLEEGVRAFLDACSDPVMMRIGLRDAPAVLGWEEWREIGDRHGLGLVTGGLQAAMDAGQIVHADIRTLAHLLLSAFAEAALLVGSADDPRAARVEVERTLLVVLRGLRTDTTGA